jgi:hypothetical protein
MRRIWPSLLPYAAPTLVLLAILAPFFRFHKYSPLMPESLILIAGAVLLGAAIGGLARSRRALAPALMTLALCIYLFCRQDVIALLVAATNAIGPVTGHPFIVLIALAIAATGATFLICTVFRRHLDLIVVAVFGTMIVSTIALPIASGGVAASTGALPKTLNDLPPVIHIILDEHIGLAGLPQDFEGTEATKRIISTVYKDFALYSRAYSRFAETKYSLASLMNRDRGVEVADLVDGDLYSFAPTANDWFDALKQKGYAIAAYQSYWFDMCGATSLADTCYTYPLFSADPIQRSPLTTAQRLDALTEKLFISPLALQLEPLVSREALAHFRSDLAKAPRGVAYIVHLLIPHHGYLYAGDCTLRDPGHWQRFDKNGGYSAEERTSLYRSYLGQVVCTAMQMDLLFAEMKQLGIYDGATIIVHGDHGSRLGEGPFITAEPEKLHTQDKLDHFSTLLAIKSPDLRPGIRDEPVALQQIFAETFLGGSRSAGRVTGEVFVRTDEESESFGSIQMAWPDADTPVAEQSPPIKPQAAGRRGG